MRQKISSIAQYIRIPAVCALCHHYHQGKFAVCKFCSALLLPIKHACKTCALPLPESQFMQCGSCIKQKNAFDKVFSTYLFEEPLRTLLHEFKYREGLYLRTYLANLMLDALPDNTYKPDCLVPVPMHFAKLKQRGFNHATLLAKILAKRTGIPLNAGLCKKVINTAPQVNLNSKHRRRNLKNAFIANATDYQHITLIDDLLTTGSTANALALALKNQGVLRVDVWCLARTAGQ